MANEFDPKQQFQNEVSRREKWAQFASDPTLHVALSFALAKMTSSGVSSEQLLGANGLIHVLLNLSEDKPQHKPMPTRHLTSYDKPTISGNSPTQ